ncbi:MAG: FAD-binding oxidoreductase [Rhizobiaceae bacterium]
MTIDAKLIEQFIAITGRAHALTPPEDLARYTQENRGILHGVTPLVLKPNSTMQVSQIVKLAAETRTALVPQGGHTGHAAGGSPDASGNQVVVCLERMNRVREVDVEGKTLTVEAGVLLQNVQQVAAAHDLLFPLSLASQGSCQIGGNIATNAGGTAVLSYGNTRDLVLGLEVVLPSGEIWSGLRRLKKDNSGYSLRNLFIGSEGTLGIITAAVLKLFPMPRGREVAFVGLNSPQAALSLLNIALSQAGPALTSFELMPAIGLEFALKHGSGLQDPLAKRHPWNVLLEISSGRSQADATELAEGILTEAYEAGIVAEDAVLAGSIARQNQLWSIREQMPGAQKPEGGSIKHDISVPVHLVPQFLQRAEVIIREVLPDSRICAFGHLGDGNLHYNISQPVGADTEAFLSRREEINALIHALVLEMDGSISAEHGIGQLKRQILAQTKSPAELGMMRTLKLALDPLAIMNPGKLI